VFDLAGRSRGVVRTTLWNGAHDVMTVAVEGEEDWLLPVVPEFIREVDVAAGRVVVDPHE
jgi:ribosomal 30S subunit maturation factor RimM